MASSKTLFKFRCVKAEHSRYFCALISLATARACSYETGSIFLARRLSAVALSSRKSSLVPTRMMGTLGAWCSISGYHCGVLVHAYGKNGSRGADPYLGLHVVERWRADNGETDQKHISLWVRERPQSIIILLSSSVPKTQADGFPIHHNTGRVVVKATTGSADFFTCITQLVAYTVGMYSPGKALVVYEIRRHVCECVSPMAPFPELRSDLNVHLSDSSITSDDAL